MKTASLFLIYCITALYSYGQQEEAAINTQGKRYIDLNLRSLEKYSRRVENKQRKILSKLRRQERRLVARLDSASIARYQQRNPSFDSISRLQQADSATRLARIKGKRIPVLDSLKGVQSFVMQQAGAESGISSYGSKLSALQEKMAYQQYISSLIDRQGQNLKNVAAGAGVKISGLTGMQKSIFYGKEQMKVFRQMSDDPSIAEEKALEYLQGIEGFDLHLSKAIGSENEMQSLAGKNLSAEYLEKMGYQTKRQMSEHLKQQFGDNLPALEEQMSGQLENWQSSLGKLPGTDKLQEGIKEAAKLRSSVGEAKGAIKETKGGFGALRNSSKPSFKVNPMRGLPLISRIEKQYTWQTTRANEGKPATLELSAMAGFRHTPRLSYGIGIATSIGLGQGWSNIRISFEGLGLRGYGAWQWQYGIGVYVGYERTYKQASLFSNEETQQIKSLKTIHNTANYSESILLGLSKTYRLNSKWNGAVQVLYDVWWKEKGLRSPVVLRFATIK